MAEILTLKKNIIWDATTFSTFQGCARKYDFRFNHHLVRIDGKGKSLEMGSIVHRALEVYHKNLISGQSRSVAVSCGMVAGMEYAQNNEEVRNTSEEDKQWALDTCEQYFDFWKNDHWTHLEAECVKGKIIYEDDEMRILWKAKFDDIVDMDLGIHPMDHKTFSQRRDDTTLNNQFIGQCTILGVRRIFINKIGFQKTLKPHERFQRVPLTFSVDRMLEWCEDIVPFWTRLLLAYKEGEYYPPCWSACETKWGKCEYTQVCESERAMRETELKRLFKVSEQWDILNEA